MMRRGSPAVCGTWTNTKVFAIGADQDAAVKAAIAAIAAGDRTPFRDGEIAETVHCMNKTDQAFRLIVMRRARSGFVRRAITLALSRHRQQSREWGRASDDGMAFEARRHQREPDQGFEDRLRHEPRLTKKQ
jgi:hypothetical protein